MKHRLTLLRSLLILLAGSFLVLSPAFAENEISHKPIDEELQQAEEKTEKGDFASLTKSLKEGGNVYDTAYALAKKASIKDVNDAFKSISENLNTQYNCSLSANDISNVAATNVQLNAAFAGLADKRAFAISGDKVAESCFKIAQCVRQADHEPNSSSIEESYSLETYPLCTSTIQKAYTDTIGVIGKVNRLSNANNGDDIFYNGKLDDSPFDLLVDIQLIGDVLFKNNTKAPEVTLYGSNQSDGSAGGGNENGNTTSLNYQDFSPEEFMQLAMNATDMDSSVLSLMENEDENTMITNSYTSTI